MAEFFFESLPDTKLYTFEKIKDNSDKKPPEIVKSTGILTFAFDVGGQTISNQGITIIPKPGDNGQAGSIIIQGAAGTSAISEPVGAPNAFIRVYKLKKEDNSDKFIYEKLQGIEALDDGSFSQEIIGVEQGDRIILTVEKGDIALDQEFVLSFSEPLDTDYENGDVPISIYEYQGKGTVKKNSFTHDYMARAVGKKPSETRDKPHFQRHSCPCLNFLSENALFVVFSRNFHMETAFFLFSGNFNTWGIDG